MTSPEVSVIIRAFNEEHHLLNLLEGIRTQDCSSAEVIVVDSGSYDRTPDIAKEWGARLVQMRDRDFTFGYSLNLGIETARGRFIAIASAHTRPVDSGWLSALVAPLHDPEVAMCYGGQRGTADSKYSEIQDFRRTFGPDRLDLRPPHFFANNANSAVSRERWEAHKFDEALPGLEDIEFAKHWMERGYRVVYEPRASVYHIHEETWRKVRRRYHREAVAARVIGVKRPRDVPREIAREARWWVGDLVTAARERQAGRRWREITLFRANKTIGTVRGLFGAGEFADQARRSAFYFDKAYESVVIRAPGRAALEEVQMPALKPGDVLIQVAFVGICHTDLEILDGSLGYYRSGVAHYPITPGHEFSGRVARVGTKVEGFQEGDAVVAECIQGCGDCKECKAGRPISCAHRVEVGVIGLNGAYAQYVVVPSVFLHKIPAGMSLRVAAAAEPLAVVLKGIRRLGSVWGRQEKRAVGIVGAGPIGHLAARVLAIAGHDVTVYDRDAGRLDCILEAEPRVKTTLRIEDLAACDAFVEATGNADALDSMLHVSRPGSVILLLGLPYARREFSFEGVVAYDKIIIGSVGSEAVDFEEALALLGKLGGDPLPTVTFPLSRFEEAWSACRSRAHLKVALAVDDALDGGRGVPG